MRDLAGSRDGSLDFLLGLVPVNASQTVHVSAEESTVRDRANSGRSQGEGLAGGLWFFSRRGESRVCEEGAEDSAQEMHLVGLYLIMFGRN